MAKRVNDTDTFNTEVAAPKFRYMCHGCTNCLGHFIDAVVNKVVKCTKCGMEQLTKLENYIAL